MSDDRLKKLKARSQSILSDDKLKELVDQCPSPNQAYIQVLAETKQRRVAEKARDLALIKRDYPECYQQITTEGVCYEEWCSG